MVPIYMGEYNHSCCARPNGRAVKHIIIVDFIFCFIPALAPLIYFILSKKRHLTCSEHLHSTHGNDSGYLIAIYYNCIQ